MTRRVVVSSAARRDLLRLSEFLAGKSRAASDRAIDRLQSAIMGLAEMPDRGRRGPGPLRERIVPFGSGAYVVQYRVDPDAVIIARVFHTLERRPLA